MKGLSFVTLAITALARSYTFSTRTYSTSTGPFDVTLIGELSSQVYRLDTNMSNNAGVSSQTFTTESDIGDLRGMVLEAKTHDSWEVEAMWLDGTQLSMADAMFDIEDEGNVPCDLESYASSYFSFTCGKIIKFWFQHGYSNHGPYTLGINTANYCSGDSRGPINVVLHGTTGISSFELTNLKSGLRETTITADIGRVYAVTFESKTHDAWTFDEVWLNNVSFLLPADAVGMQDEGGKCQIYDYRTCIGGLQSFMCSISITLYLNWTITQSPTATPSLSLMPTTTHSQNPTLSPTTVPTTLTPTVTPSFKPTLSPSNLPTTLRPTVAPSCNPTLSPTTLPTTLRPTVAPSSNPSQSPTTMQTTSVSSWGPMVSPTVMPTSFKATLANDREGFEIPVTSTIAMLISVISCCCVFFLLCANFFLMRKKSSSSKRVMIEMIDSHEGNMMDVGYQMPNTKNGENVEGINSSYPEPKYCFSKAPEGLKDGVLQLGEFSSSDL